MRHKRTKTDFSKHELKVTKNEHVMIHELKLPKTVVHRVVFINCRGILSVTGDFGNWIFCKEFHPSQNGYISDGYWKEKASIMSEQDVEMFDSERTIEELQERIDELLADPEDLNLLEIDLVAYYNKCMKKAKDSLEWEYMHFAYNEKPSFFDPESIVFIKSLKPRLLIVFDAFEEICERMQI